jgi:hypothetical protein
MKGPSTIKKESLASACQLGIVLQPPDSRYSPSLNSSPLVNAPIRLTKFLCCGEPSDSFFPTDKWKMPRGNHIHLKTLCSDTIVSPMVKNLNEWAQRSDLIGTLLVGGNLDAMADSLFPPLSEKNLCTFENMKVDHCDLVVRGGFYTNLHLDLQGKSRSHCIVTPGSLKIWIIADSKKDSVTSDIKEYLKRWSSSPVDHQIEIDWLLEHHHYFQWVLQYPGQALEHCGSYYHAVITMVDMERNPYGWCVSTGVQYITELSLVREYKHAAPLLQRGSRVVPVSKRVYLKTVVQACGFNRKSVQQSINRSVEIAAKTQATKRKKKLVTDAKLNNARQQRRKYN